MNSNNQNDMHQQDEQEKFVDQAQTQAELDNNDFEQCQQDVAMWKDQAARIFADFENYKKRMEREQVSWMQTAQVSVLKDLLSIVDNFDRALLSKTDATADVYAGVEMIYKSVIQVLNKYGVKEFSNYQEFDPEYHEALMDIESADHASGQIVQVLEKGFMIKDKILRPAKVMIAK
ncbi:nucleotide exchange factor GrpE [Candidatus Babeliales bacterium]|nr:nucleotide exchange factor GrpE [Candidatus Babeliales bacterium]MBP9843845.1 nucleotide exchange factor GrpE [Candidatus Babeliales bacterium]